MEMVVTPAMYTAVFSVS